MNKNIKKVLRKLDIHTLDVVRKSSSATVVKMIGMLVGLVVSILLGRLLGAKGLGIINIANRVVSILIILALIGMPQLLIKEIAIAFQRKDWQYVRNCISSSLKLNGGLAIIISVAVIALAPWLSTTLFHEPILKIPLIIAVSVMVFQVCSRIFASGLVGFGKIWQSNLVNESLSVAVVGVVLLFLWIFDIQVTVINVAAAYGLGRITVTISVNAYWKKINRKNLAKPVNVGSKLAKAAWPFLLVSATSVVSSNIDVLLLGWLGDAREVGLYTVAAKIAMLTIFFLQVTNSAISPKIASLYAEGKLKEINKMVQNVTIGLMVVAVLPLIFFIFGGNFLLSLWGKEFEDAYWMLIILSIGQSINIATGPSGLVLAMCGFEKLQSNILIICLLLNIVLDYLLIPMFGGIGAALGSSFSMIVLNIVKIIYAKSKVGVITVPKIRLN